MSRRFEYQTAEAFLDRLSTLEKEGIPRERIRVHTPYHLPECEELLVGKPDLVRLFALGGGLSGFIGGFALTIFTVLSWPLITGGKPVVSVPPFLIIAYLLTILFGSLASFAGFLLLARLPSIRGMTGEQEFSELFTIVIEEEVER